jgi:F0F1-type ATP synthase beta subunit
VDIGTGFNVGIGGAGGLKKLVVEELAAKLAVEHVAYRVIVGE